MAERICIVGAGAIGSYLTCRLSDAGIPVTLLARGARHEAIRANGVTTRFRDGREVTARPELIAQAEEVGEADYVLVCVKAFAVAEAAAPLLARLGEATRVVFVQNGIPWWSGAEQPEDRATELLDPGRRLAGTLPLSRIFGCVTYANVRNLGPGRAEHVADDTFVLGQPDGGESPELQRLVELMGGAGIEARVSRRIRQEVWQKLWGNLAFNPISALTGMTMDEIITDPATRPIVIAMMEEARAVARRQGIEFPIGIERRLEIAEGAGRFKTSMLQDLEAGRRMEIDAILGVVSASGAQLEVPTPTVNVVLGLLRQKARGLGLD